MRTRAKVDKNQAEIVQALRKAGASEHDEQVALFDWAKLRKAGLPALDMMFAIPNGGLRHVAVAKKLKAEGVRSGVPDVALMCPRGKYHGMFIEMKVGENTTTVTQRDWLSRLSDAGYYCVICYSTEEAIGEIEWYLEGYATSKELP